MSYTIDTTVDGAFDDVVEDAIDALQAEDFGVLCDIDVRRTLQEKLNEEFRNYRILGACNPQLAHGALETELGLGTLLPCNVVVYETDGGDITVRAVDPERLVGIAENPDLDSVAQEVHERFERVLEVIGGAHESDI